MTTPVSYKSCCLCCFKVKEKQPIEKEPIEEEKPKVFPIGEDHESRFRAIQSSNNLMIKSMEEFQHKKFDFRFSEGNEQTPK